MIALPITEFLDSIERALISNSVTILQAAPGAGKSTEVPLRVLTFAKQKILLLEPRRVAARSLAQYLSAKLGERPGETIGYRMRGEMRVSASTKLEIITEGLLTRMILDDPALDGIGYLLFDEFHERSLQTDAALAMACEVQRHLRPDLKLLIMSATLDAARLRALFPGAAAIEVPGRVFPVETFYRGRPDRFDDGVASAVHEAARRSDGDVLVFLPGRSEIERCKQRLRAKEIHVLTADTSAEEARILFGGHAEPRIILATSVAETSITLPSVRAVVDSGVSRYAIFNSGSGMNELVTRRATESVAEQRRGRAGRVAAGLCFRLWEEGEVLLPFLEPEIVRTDLSTFALDLFAFGSGDPRTLTLLDQPPAASWEASLKLLAQLGAVSERGSLSEHGRELSRFGVHPRIGHLLLRARDLGFPASGALCAALLESNTRLDQTLSGSAGRDHPERVRHHADRLRAMLGGKERQGPVPYARFIAYAYPERLGRKTSRGTFRLAAGGEARLPEKSSLSNAEFLAIGRLEMHGSSGRISVAEPISLSEVRESYPVTSGRELGWEGERLQALEVQRVGELVIEAKPVESTAAERESFFLSFVADGALHDLLAQTEAAPLVARSEWGRAQGLFGGDWPVLSFDKLSDELSIWLAPYLSKISRKSELLKLNVREILQTLFSYQQLQELEKTVPETLSLPSGTQAKFEYGENGLVSLSVILQELFGRATTPFVGGKPVMLQLLSPAKRPIQLTSSLDSFWSTVYPELRRQLSRDYPRHYWPEDPLAAQPVSKGLKSRLRRP